MKAFQITGPDGRKYKITGEDPQGALRALEEMLGGRTLSEAAEVPRGQDGVPEGYFVDPRTGAMTSRELLRNNAETGAGTAARHGLMQGLGFGLGDELAGLAGYVEGGSEMANLRREQARAMLEANENAHPYAYGAGEIGGAVATGIATGAAAGIGGSATLGRQVLTGAGMGATEGAAYGAGNAEGLGGRVNAAIKEGMLGGLIGAAAPIAISGVRYAHDHTLGPILSGMRSAPDEVRAGRAINTMIERSGMSPDDLTNAVRTARAAGQPYTLADAAGRPGQRMLSGMVRSLGDGSESREIAEFLMQRQGEQARRVGSTLDDALLAPRNALAAPGPQPVSFAGKTAAEAAEALDDARMQAAIKSYGKARQNAGPVDVRSALSVIDERIGPMQGSGISGDGIDGTLNRFRDRLAASNPGAATPGGGPSGATSVELSDFGRVLGVKQDLQDAIGKANRTGEYNAVRELKKLEKALDEALEAASPDYRAANDAYAQASRVIDQIEAGMKSTSSRTRAGDTARHYNALTPDEQAAFRVGYSDPVFAKIENSTPGVNKVRSLLDDGTAADLAIMARDPDALAAYLEREATMTATGQRALGGSLTADNLADQQDIGRLGAGAISNFLSGGLSGAAVKSADFIVNALAGRNTATRETIAKLLLSDDAAAAIAPYLSAQARNALVRNPIAGAIRGASRPVVNALIEER